MLGAASRRHPPAFCLGVGGGGFASTTEEALVAAGLAASPIGQVLVERSLLGWYEIEFEVLRDAADTTIAICGMENLDPMGVHTGDSIVVAPIQTLPDPVVQRLRRCALKIVRALHLEGGCNVQLAVAPDGTDYRVIEVNPRVSRSIGTGLQGHRLPDRRGWPPWSRWASGWTSCRTRPPASAPPPSSQRSTTSWSSCRAGRSTSSRGGPVAGRPDEGHRRGDGHRSRVRPALLKAVRSLEPRGRGWTWEDAAWG